VEGDKTEDAKPKKEREPTSFSVQNPARIIPAQARFISLNPEQRYVPVSRKSSPSGIILLADHDPSAPEDVARCK
jgi:26S proteasome regulatory subunit N2